MNTEKQITITDLRGKFTKDFDTFGKMDPFVELTVGKCSGRTETASSAGKEPAWKNSVVLTYFDETTISVKAYDEDATENEYIGSGKIEIKTLRFPGGAIEVNILTENGESIGTLNAKYTIKNLNPTPLLLVKNIRCSFVKEHEFIKKSKPFIQLSTEDGKVCSQTKEDGMNGLAASWTEQLRLRVKENSRITISLLDKNSANSSIFSYECNAKEFRIQNGSKKFNVLDQDYYYLGVIEFDFETVNLVSKEESVKNGEREKKIDNELTSISIEKVKTELNDEDKNIYYNFIVGTNKIATEVIKSVPKSSSLDIKKVVYADSKENKLIILIWESNLLKDKVIGCASLPLDGLGTGEKKATLMDTANKEEVGTISLNLNLKQVPSKTILLDNIAVEFTEGGDIIGQSEPYIVARIGGASNRTQTGDKQKFTFKRGVELKCFDEEVIQLQIWDEDITNDELLFKQKLKISELKGVKGELSLKLIKNDEKSSSEKAKISFRYEIKAVSQNQPKKMSEKKAVEVVQPPPQVKQEIKEEKPKEPQIKQKEKVASIPKQPQIVPILPEVAPKVEPVKQQVKPIEPEPQKSEINHQSRKSIQNILEKQSNTIDHQNSDRQNINLKRSSIRKTEESKPQQSRMQSLNRNNGQSRKKEESFLPSIVSSHLNYGDKIFDKQSAATLQKSIVAYTMPKANRFINEPKYSGQPTYCIDSCFKSSSLKGVGFGFGRKKQYPDWVQKNMKDNPPPGAYLESGSDHRPKGPTFGISHKYYERVMIPKQKQPHAITNRKLSPIRDIK